MKLIELAIYTPAGQIKTDTGFFAYVKDARVSVDKAVEQNKKYVSGDDIIAGQSYVSYQGHYCAVAGFKIVDAVYTSVGTGLNAYRKVKDLSEFVPVETNYIKHFKVRFANGEMDGVDFSQVLCRKI